MKKLLILLIFFVKIVISESLIIDFSDINPLTSAIFRGVEKAFEVNEQGLTAMDAGDFEAAESLFIQAAGMLPIYSDAKNNLGVLYFRTGRTADAKKLWREVVRVDPEYASAFMNLGLIAMNAGEIGEARNLAAAAYSISPYDSEIWSNFAFILLAAGDTAQAVKILERKVPAQSAILMLGEIYAVQGNYRKARSYLESLRISGRENRDYFETLAAVYNELKMYDRTENLFHEAQMHGDEISPSFWISYAWALFEQGKKDEAIDIFSRKSAENPEDENLKMTLVYLLINSGRFAEANEIQGTTTMSATDNLYNQALILHLAGDIDGAKALYRKLLGINRRHHRAWNNLGAIYGSRGEIASAISAYRRAARRRADIIDGYVNLANIYFLTGDRRRTNRWIRRGLRISPNNEALLYFRENM